MIKGVDLSTYNKNVDYEQLKNDGIEFAILRCGYGKDESQKDELFDLHYEGCKRVGIKVGAYHYSYCNSLDNAILEAENCLSYLEGKEFDLPIYYDLEERRIAELGIDIVTQIALTFCRKIEEKGYRAGVYANLNWFKNYIRPEALELENFSIWLAQWSNEMTADFNVDIWQYTNNLEAGFVRCDGDYLINENLLNDNISNPIDVNICQSLAVDVIFGKYGNGQERKDKLGNYYDEVQEIVNKIYNIVGG